ncbi:PAS domain-containing protein [Streptomyces xantholiticus]|uniref:PAS domain-containing protein n=1 Tax=Streptomyces xantholiticus TaxID=68285 RepID=A0ABV1UXZ6_9ACTN
MFRPRARERRNPRRKARRLPTTPPTPRTQSRALPLLLAATPSPYPMAAPDLVIVDVNEAYLRATGRSREDLVGRHVFEAFPDTRPDGVRSGGPRRGGCPPRERRT